MIFPAGGVEKRGVYLGVLMKFGEKGVNLGVMCMWGGQGGLKKCEFFWGKGVEMIRNLFLETFFWGGMCPEGCR